MLNNKTDTKVWFTLSERRDAEAPKGKHARKEEKAWMFYRRSWPEGGPCVASADKPLHLDKDASL